MWEYPTVVAISIWFGREIEKFILRNCLIETNRENSLQDSHRWMRFVTVKVSLFTNLTTLKLKCWQSFSGKDRNWRKIDWVVEKTEIEERWAGITYLPLPHEILLFLIQYHFHLMKRSDLLLSVRWNSHVYREMYTDTLQTGIHPDTKMDVQGRKPLSYTQRAKGRYGK